MKCDYCKNVFELSENQIIEKIITDDIKEKYFVCPKCEHHYKIIITDKEMRKAIEKRKLIQTIIQTKYKGSRNEKQIRKLMKEDEQLKEFLVNREKEIEQQLKTWPQL